LQELQPQGITFTDKKGKEIFSKPIDKPARKRKS